MLQQRNPLQPEDTPSDLTELAKTINMKNTRTKISNISLLAHEYTTSSNNNHTHIQYRPVAQEWICTE